MAPSSSLGKIADYLKKDKSLLVGQWNTIRPQVVARLQEQLPIGRMETHELRSKVILPALASCEPSSLRKLLVCSIITSSNTAQLDRDNKALRDLWVKRSKKLNALTVGEQVRLSINFSERCSEMTVPESTRHRQEARRMACGIVQLWEHAADGENGREHRDGQSSVRSRSREDKNKVRGSSQIRKFPEHFSEADKESACKRLRK